MAVSLTKVRSGTIQLDRCIEANLGQGMLVCLKDAGCPRRVSGPSECRLIEAPLTLSILENRVGEACTHNQAAAPIRLVDRRVPAYRRAGSGGHLRGGWKGAADVKWTGTIRPSGWLLAHTCCICWVSESGTQCCDQILHRARHGVGRSVGSSETLEHPSDKADSDGSSMRPSLLGCATSVFEADWKVTLPSHSAVPGAECTSGPRSAPNRPSEPISTPCKATTTNPASS